VDFEVSKIGPVGQGRVCIDVAVPLRQLCFRNHARLQEYRKFVLPIGRTWLTLRSNGLHVTCLVPVRHVVNQAAGLF
jgi:hypothetical protein